MKLSNTPKFILVGLALIFCGSLFGTGIADRIVATVGNEIILESEVQEGVDFIKLMGQNTDPDSVLRAQVIDEIIDNRLILEEAKKETVETTKSEVEEEVEKNIAMLRQRFENEEQFQDALKNEGVTEKILRERYREDIRRRLISQKLLTKKGLTNINITPTEVQKFYNLHKDSIARQPGEITIAHILFLLKPSTSEEEAGQKKISEIFDIIARGGDFEEVAKSFSEDEATKNKSGYLGVISPDLLQPEVQAAIANLKPQEISQPFRSRNGYEIIKVVSRKNDKIELAHIMVKVQLTRADSMQTKKTAQNVRAMLLKGASFDSLVKIYSDDPMTKDSGGFLGAFLITGLQEPYRSAIEKLPVGGISEPVLSEHGYHLIKVLEKQEERVLALEEMQDQIRNYLYDETLKGRLTDYLTRIAQTTYIAKHID